jgi:hypothetical protein
VTRRVTPAELQRLLRQQEQKQRQAVNKYNSAARKYNADAKRAQDQHNKAVDQHNRNVRAAKQAIDNYNRDVRTHNARVRTHQRRLAAERARLASHPNVDQFSVVRSSAVALDQSFDRVDADIDAGVISAERAALVDLAEGEAANSARLANALLGSPAAAAEAEDTELTDELSSLSPDLDSRWRGALYSLSPQNPDAARHFCTSAREVLVKMLDLKASDHEVLRANPQCPTTDRGKPTRRAKIDHLLATYGDDPSSLSEFIDADVNDVLNLFREFNDATHGSAGTFDLVTLRAMRTRVEGSIRFVSRIIRRL